jgi:hypothetical protein
MKYRKATNSLLDLDYDDDDDNNNNNNNNTQNQDISTDSTTCKKHEYHSRTRNAEMSVR